LGLLNGLFTRPVETFASGDERADGVSLRTFGVGWMSRAAAWNIRGIGRDTRDAAEEAARRAGVNLSEWLDDVIVERATEQGVDPDDFDSDDRLDAIADRLTGLSRRDETHLPNRPAEADKDYAPVRRLVSREETKRAEDLLEAAIARFETRAAKNEQRTARALDKVAGWIEKSDEREEKRAFEASIAKRNQNETATEVTDRAAQALSAMRQVESVARDLDKRMNDLAERMEAAERGRRDASRQRPRIDLAEAVSQIARRRQALDASQAAAEAAPPSADQAKGWRHFGVDIPANAPSAAEPVRDVAKDNARDNPAGDLRVELQRLNQRLDELRREQSERGGAAQGDVAALRAELMAMSRALADLAPRNAIVAIEGAVRDLSDRVASLRDNSLRDSLIKPVDEIVAAIRETLQAHDPRKAVAGLEREIGAIGGRLDALARTRVDPQAIEHIRQQTEEVRAMLSAAALRPMPVDRLERQIGELADRVDRLASSRSPQIDSAQVVASLANAHAEMERSTPVAALAVIEQRLEDIAARMDQALGRSQSASTINAKAVEELARRIDSVRETIETRHPLPIVSASLEATMRELAAKLQDAQSLRFDAEPLEAWMRDVSAKLETARPIALDTKPLESWMRELTAKLESVRPHELDTKPLEQALRAIDDKISQTAAPPFESQIVDQTARALAREIEAKYKPALDTGAIEALIRGLEDKLEHAGGAEAWPEGLAALRNQIAGIDARLDQTHADLAALNSMGRLVGQFSTKLDEMRDALRNASAAMAERGDGAAAAARDIDSLRATQEASERRVQTSLTGVQGLLEKLFDRMVRIEDDAVRASRAPVDSRIASGAVASTNGAAYAEGPPPATTSPFANQTPKRSDAPPVAIAGERAISRAAAAGLPRVSDSPDFLIEPGAGAPVAVQPKNAVNAHIAAARRAAQATMSGAAPPADKAALDAATPSAFGRPVTQAKAFLNARRRPILLGLAFVILGAIAVVELGAMYVVKSQKSQIAPPPLEKSASTAPIEPQKSESRAVDLAPTGAVAPPAALPPAPAPKAPVTAPADLVSLIPPTTPQSLRELAASGDPAAQYELAARLFEGRNMPRDMHAASQWFERAAAQDFVPAQYRLGACYEKGNGVERDLQAAKIWYQKAADAGHVRAMHNLAVLLAEGPGAKPDYAEAANWFRKAAQFGVKDSQYNLAILYARGMGVGVDLNQSWLWFSLAAQQGDADAAKKRDEIAAKLESNALAADGATLAAFRPRQPNPDANEVKTPDGGWDAKPSPQATQTPIKLSRPATAL
jgi:localization factor PodJL